MEDNYKHKGLRKKLAEIVKNKGILNSAVLEAIETVPRHLFFSDSAFAYIHAYDDKAFPIGSGQTISQPYTVALQTELLELNSGEKVLEIGTGSGYQTAVLACFGVKIYSIERVKTLYDKTRVLMAKLKIQAKLFYGDGYLGLPTFAPFDKIIATAGAPSIPPALLQQLKIGGIMVIPVGEGSEQIMKRIIKKSENEYVTEEHGVCRFVPMLEKRVEEK
ncbi:MAG: protein-L-isoaspartate(D-aspartate) O-methyltransferase [Flavobacteriales bacterium]|nr:protein-L-isoaspartate(D-aspartate) O-methyltransferase [Flavobacteriales bacterium]